MALSNDPRGTRLPPAKLASIEGLADELRAAAELLLRAAKAIDDLKAVAQPPAVELDEWFRELRGERAADFLISFEPHIDHRAVEIGETMLGNGWMAADSLTPTENARGALERLVRKGLATRVGPGLYRTTRRTPLLHDLEVD